MKKSVSIYRTLGVMILMTLVGKFMGLYRDLFLGASLGLSMEADAFNAAAAIPLNFFDITLSAAVASTFIPIFTQELKTRGQRGAFDYVNQFITLGGLLTLGLALISVIFAGPIVKILNPGFMGDQLALTVTFTKIMSPIILFAFLTFTFVGLMQKYEHYQTAALISVFSNLAVIIYLIFFVDQFGLVGLAIAFVVGWALQALVQVPVLKRHHYTFRPNWHFKSSAMKSTLYMTGPALLSTAAQPLSLMVTRMFASFYPGGFTSLQYANRVFTIVVGISVYSITNYVFPKLAALYHSESPQDFGDFAQQIMVFFAYFILPVTGLLYIYGQPVMQVLFTNGQFTVEDARLTGQLLSALALGLVGTGLREILNRMYFATGNTKKPLVVTLVGLVVTVVCVGLFNTFMGLEGLALGLSVSMTLTAGLQLLMAYKDGMLAKPGGKNRALAKIVLVDMGLLALVALVAMPATSSKLYQLGFMMLAGLVTLGLHVLILYLLNVKVPTLKIKEEV